MFGIKGKLLGGLGLVALLIIVSVAAWGFSWKADARFWQGRSAHWDREFHTLAKQSGDVLSALRIAADNPKLRWEDAPQQAKWLGEAFHGQKAVIDIQTAKVNDLGLERARLQALNDDLRKQAQALIAKKGRVIARLDSDALTPGERQDCARQLREAETALDLIFQEGL